MRKERPCEAYTSPGLLLRANLKAVCGIWFAAISLSFTSPGVCGETFRLNKVVAEGTANSERMELNQEGKSQVLFIEKQAIVTGADVKSAMRSPSEENSLAITLTEDGGMKLGAATADARGDMRIAILIDEKVVSAPVVMAKLGNSFALSGLKEYPDDELDLLGWRIEGISDEEIAKRLRLNEIASKTPLPPRPKPEYYSDEEYAALKKEREKVGMFYMDELPTEEQLGKRLKLGMTQTEVIGELGKATSTHFDDAGRLDSLNYSLAPERRSLTREAHPDGFEVQFLVGKVSHWKINIWTSAPREPKPQGKNLRRLKAKFPGEGVADKDFGTIPWIEKVELFLQPGQQKPHSQDYADLISMIYNLATTADETLLIEANCTVVKTLADGFPEVEALRKTAKDDKISLQKLNDLLKPYILGEKPFP
jgi:hypothetical protein